MKKYFYNHPIYINESEYNLAKGNIINTFSMSQDVRAIFEYGSINNMGISDLDIIVVLKKNISRNCYKFISKDMLTVQTLKVIDYANIIILTEEKINQLLIWDDLKLTQILGNQLIIDKYMQIEIEIARIIDWLPERIIRIEETLLNSKINVRKTLGLLKSSCYTLNSLIKKFNLRIDSFINLIDQINKLRKDWFSFDKDESEKLLLKLLIETKENMIMGLNIFDSWLFKFYSKSHNNCAGNATLSFPNNYNFIFSNNTDKRIISLDNNQINLNLSIFYFLHFQTYASEIGLISSKLKESFATNFNYNQLNKLPYKYHKVLQERIGLCNIWANYLADNNFKNGLFKMGWFYNN